MSKISSDGGNTDYFNIGTDSGNTVLEVLRICESIVNKKIPVNINPKRPGDPAILIADSTKAKNILGWTPKYELRYSIKTAYEWEKKKQTIMGITTKKE